MLRCLKVTCPLLSSLIFVIEQWLIDSLSHVVEGTCKHLYRDKEGAASSFVTQYVRGPLEVGRGGGLRVGTVRE